MVQCKQNEAEQLKEILYSIGISTYTMIGSIFPIYYPISNRNYLPHKYLL